MHVDLNEWLIPVKVCGRNKFPASARKATQRPNCPLDHVASSICGRIVFKVVWYFSKVPITLKGWRVQLGSLWTEIILELWFASVIFSLSGSWSKEICRRKKLNYYYYFLLHSIQVMGGGKPLYLKKSDLCIIHNKVRKYLCKFYFWPVHKAVGWSKNIWLCVELHLQKFQVQTILKLDQVEICTTRISLWLNSKPISWKSKLTWVYTKYNIQKPELTLVPIIIF